MNRTLISIIIPVYNVEPYLKQCLDSIIIQDAPSWEAILVDDGSTDGSSDICDEYANKDPHFRVFHKENGGVSSARNIGLEEAKGKWIWFVDGDDYIENNALPTLRKGINQDCDTIFHGLTQKFENGDTIFDNHDEDMSLKKKDFLLKHYCYQNGMILFSSKIIKENNLRFSEGIRMGEDMEFQYKYLLLCKKPIRIKNSLYFYRQRHGSAIANPNSHRNNVKDCTLVSNNLLLFVKQHNIQEELWFSRRIRLLLKGILQSAETLPYKEVNEIGKVIRHLISAYKEAGFANIEDKTINLAKVNLVFYFYLLRLYFKIKGIR